MRNLEVKDGHYHRLYDILWVTTPEKLKNLAIHKTNLDPFDPGALSTYCEEFIVEVILNEKN